MHNYNYIDVGHCIYVFLFAVHLAFLPEPVYRGPELVTYFRGPYLEVKSVSGSLCR